MKARQVWLFALLRAECNPTPYFLTSPSRWSNAVLRARCSWLRSGHRLIAEKRVITGLFCSVKLPARLWKTCESNTVTALNHSTTILNNAHQWMFSSFTTLPDIFLHSLISLRLSTPLTVPRRLAATSGSPLVHAHWEMSTFSRLKQITNTLRLLFSSLSRMIF